MGTRVLVFPTVLPVCLAQSAQNVLSHPVHASASIGRRCQARSAIPVGRRIDPCNTIFTRSIGMERLLSVKPSENLTEAGVIASSGNLTGDFGTSGCRFSPGLSLGRPGDRCS